MPSSPTPSSNSATPNGDSGGALGGSCAKRDAGNGGIVHANLNGASRASVAPKAGPPSFASVVSSFSSGTTKSPLTTSRTSSETHPQQQEHARSQSSSHISSPPASPPSLGNKNSKNAFINGTSFCIGNGVATNTSTQTTFGPISSVTAPTASPTFNSNRDGDTHDSSDENYQDDSESSDVEIYLDTLELHDSAARMHVTAGAVSSNPTTTNPSPTPSHLHRPPSASQGQGPHHQTMPTEHEHNIPTITHDYIGSRDQPRLPQQGQQHGPSPCSSVLGPNGTYGLGVTSISQPNSNNFNDTSSNKSPSSLPTNNFIPLSASPSMQQQHQQKLFVQQPNLTVNGSGAATRQHTPGPPGNPSVPLPEIDSDQLQPQSSTIDLASLSTGGAAGSTSGSAGPHLGHMGMPTSHSQPLFSTNHTSSVNPTVSFPTSVSESVLGPTGSADASSDPNAAGVVKTPNVYINGLPPHFPEDELFNLCQEFGPIRSVRTFTRHVRDSESGYGFVLFENVDDAEKCIISLRRYRNLHPTFSKQQHKIPGTNFAAGPSSSSSSLSWHESMSSEDTVSGSASFKAKMESLHDPTSTNLYMEGLPLSITEDTLSALVKPHNIVSSRFFHTRLSNPPRIIAFVRLETRIGAEKVIERLHGRMVRGWNDTGCRISVRFADTSEQRELRRNERAQEDDPSPARLSIAQASLLNLQGQQLHPNKSASVIHAHGVGGGVRDHIPSSTSTRSFSGSMSVPDFSTRAAHLRLGAMNQHLNLPVIGSGGQPTLTVGGTGLEVDYTLAPGRKGSVGNLRSISPYGHGYQQDQYGMPQSHSVGHGFGQAPSPVDPSMSTLLDSLRANGVPYRGANVMGYRDDMGRGEVDMYGQNGGMGMGLQQIQHQLQGGSFVPPLQQHQLATSQSLDNLNMQQFVRPSPAFTRSGYTPTEEYIMRAHAEAAQQQQDVYQQPNQERRRPAPLDLTRQRAGEGGDDATNIAVGMRGYRAQASLMSPTVMSTSASMNSMQSFGSTGSLGSLGDMRMGEADFHSGLAPATSTVAAFRNLHATRLGREPGSAPANFSGAYQSLQRQMPIPPSQVSASSNQNQSHESSPPPGPGASLMSPNPNEIMSAYHQQVSAPHMRSTTLPQHRQSSAVGSDGLKGHSHRNSMSMPKQTIGTPQHASVARLGVVGGMESSSPSGTIYENEGPEEREYHHQSETSASNTNSGHLGSSTTAGEGHGYNHSVNQQSTPAPSTAAAMKSQYTSSTIFDHGDTDQASASPMSASSSLISPALTYASHTPSTLSPATPFFGSFNSGAETFEKTSGETQQVQQKKVVQQSSVVGLRSGSR